MSSETRSCKSCNKDFVIEPDDFGFYEKMAVPPPTWCPECRLQRRLAWRNGKILFRRKDNASGKEIFSSFPPIDDMVVYEHEYWKSDAWNPLEYGRDYDFSRTFFDQYRDLLRSVPWPSKSVQNMVNSEYCDQAGYFKNCYLCFNGDRMEDSAYCNQSNDSKNCLDCTLSSLSELCYECISVNSSYQTLFSQDCESCADTLFSRNCTGCNNCFGCVNLKNKSYHFFNQPCSKEEYEQKIKDLHLDTRAGLEQARIATAELFLKFPNKYYHGYRIVGSSGDYLRNTKNVHSSYFADDAQDGKYLYNVYMGTKDSYDYGPWGNGSSQMYECLTCGDHCEREKFCFESWPACRELEYCCFCRSSSNCFGCVSVKKAEYCILNKQYTRDEYITLKAKIIEQMKAMPYRDAKGREYGYGEFFPEELSPFAYNEVELHHTYPLTKESALAEGRTWRDPDAREFVSTVQADKLPDAISTVDDSILKEIIQCRSCKKAYRVIEPELKFLRRMNLPLPDLCVACRSARRYALVNPPRYYPRQCQCAGIKDQKGDYANTAAHAHGSDPCANQFETSYAPDRPEILYCEECYQAEVA